jgi:hypothetical protein
MEYQITVHLTDQEYIALTAEATRSGKQPETILHELMSERFQTSSSAKSSLTEHEFMEQLYREGDLLNIPLRRPLTEQERALREHLAQVFSGGKPLSEMVIEDRGPY